MDRTTLKRILQVYNIVLMVISGIAITLGVILYLNSLAIWLVPISTAFSLVGGGALVGLVGLLGFLVSTLKGEGERNTLIAHIVGLVVVVVIQMYMTGVLMASHGATVKDPVGIVTSLFGYHFVITWFGKYIGLLVILLTIPQIIAIYVAVRILTTKPSLLPTVTFS